MKTSITLAQRVSYTKFGLETKTVQEVIELIRDGEMLLTDPDLGEYRLKDITEAIRSQSTPEVQNWLKEYYLPVVTFNGIWDGQAISTYSCITALDFDNITTQEQLNSTLDLLKATPYVLAIFRTFKPFRIKALVMHDNTDPAKHTEMYWQLIEIFKGYGLDKSGRDLSRRTYLVWDKDIWVNKYCIPYHFVPSTPGPISIATNTQMSVHKTAGKSKSTASIISILNSSWQQKHPEYWQKGQRAYSVFLCACQFCEYGVPEDMANEYFLTGGWLAQDFTESEILKNVHGAYKHKKDSYGSKQFI